MIIRVSKESQNKSLPHHFSGMDEALYWADFHVLSPSLASPVPPFDVGHLFLPPGSACLFHSAPSEFSIFDKCLWVDICERYPKESSKPRVELAVLL